MTARPSLTRAARKPKFRVGQVVKTCYEGDYRKIRSRWFDGDTWLYAFDPNAKGRMDIPRYDEKFLHNLTKRERGQ